MVLAREARQKFWKMRSLPPICLPDFLKNKKNGGILPPGFSYF